jgi:phosphatidylglycerol:prolipoprotein diacylglycerol transferase
MKPIPVVFHLGPLQIHTYGIGLAVTFWIAYRYFEHRLAKRGFPTAWVVNVFVWVIVAAIVGARVMHVLANLGFYVHQPIQVLEVWHGGLSSFGGLLGGIPTGFWMTHRRMPGMRLWQAADLVAPVLLLGWAVGRLLGPQLMVAGGGHVTHQWFGMYYAGQVGKRLPVPLFQSFFTWIMLAVVLLVERRAKRRPEGLLIAIAAALWGLSRFFDESLWLSHPGPGHLGEHLVEAGALALCAAGIVTALLLQRFGRMVPGAGEPGPLFGQGATPAVRDGCTEAGEVAPTEVAASAADGAEPALSGGALSPPAGGSPPATEGHP